MNDLQYNAMCNAIDILKTHRLVSDIAKIMLFGSCARGDCSDKSDVDIQVLLSDKYTGYTKELQDIQMECYSLTPVSVDMHFCPITTWLKSSRGFVDIVNKEGIDIGNYLS